MESTIKQVFSASPKEIWNIVTDLEDVSWRSDLESIEIIEEGKFIETTKKGYKTIFYITCKDPYRCYEFTMENDNFKGKWQGRFRPVDGGTELTFTEEIYFKKPIMKVLAPIFMPVKKMQKNYFADLEKRLSKEL